MNYNMKYNMSLKENMKYNMNITYKKNTSQQIKKPKTNSFLSTIIQSVPGTKYEKLKAYLRYCLTKQTFLQETHAQIADVLDCSTRYVRELFARLREEPEFAISKPKRQKRIRKYFYPLIVRLAISLTLICSPEFLEYVTKDVIYKSYSSITKKIASYDQEIIKNRLKIERLTTNVHKLFPSSEDVAYPQRTKPYKKDGKALYMSTTPAKELPNLNKVIIGKAKRLWEEVETKNRSQFYVRRELTNWISCYQQGKQDFLIWYNSIEAAPFKQWLNTTF